MEYKSISSKLPRNEVNLFRDYCERKGVTPSSLIRELILKEIKVSVPINVAGSNKITYDKENDNFNWTVDLDNGDSNSVLNKISVEFLEDLNKEINNALDKRNSTILKSKKESVAIPSNFLK